MTLSPNVIKLIEMKSLNGDYSDEEKIPRSRKKTSRYIDESSREVNLKRKSKSKPNSKPIKKQKKSDVNLEDSDSDSISMLKSKYSKSPKRMHTLKKLERDEIQRSNSFLALSDDEDSSIDLTTLSMKANDHQLIHGDSIGKKIATSQKQHLNERLIDKQNKQASALRDIRKRKYIDNSNHITNNINININNSGSTNLQSTPSTWTNNTPHPWMYLNAFSPQTTQGDIHIQDQFPSQQMYQHTGGLTNSNTSTITSSVESLIAQLSSHPSNLTWILNYRRALEIRRAYGLNSLRRGYNSHDPSVSDWYARQKDYSLDVCKRMLMRELE